VLRILYFTRSLNVLKCRQIAFPTQVTAAWSQCRPMCTHHPSQIHRIPKLDISAQVSLGVLLHMYMTCTTTPRLVAVCNDTLLVYHATKNTFTDISLAEERVDIGSLLSWTLIRIRHPPITTTFCTRAVYMLCICYFKIHRFWVNTTVLNPGGCVYLYRRP
jgi:hypothetical protein